MSHEAQDGENHKAGEHTSAAVCYTYDDAVSVRTRESKLSCIFSLYISLEKWQQIHLEVNEYWLKFGLAQYAVTNTSHMGEIENKASPKESYKMTFPLFFLFDFQHATLFIEHFTLRLPETVIVKLVIWSHGDQSTPGTAQRIKYLWGRIPPHLQNTET